MLKKWRQDVVRLALLLGLLTRQPRYESPLAKHTRHDVLYQGDILLYVGLTPGGDFPSTSYFYDDDLLAMPDLGPPRSPPDTDDEDDFYPPPMDDLTQQEMELIEILWKQDVDMGFCVEDVQESEGGDALEQLESVDPLKQGPLALTKDEPSLVDDLWAGLSYTVDLETGEHNVKRRELGEAEPEGELPELPELPDLPELPQVTSQVPVLLAEEVSIEEALELVGIHDDPVPHSERGTAGRGGELSPGGESEEFSEQQIRRQIEILEEMIQAPPPFSFHNHHHHRHHAHTSYQGVGGGVGGRGVYPRGVRAAEPWQEELAGVFSLPHQEQSHYQPVHPPAPHAFKPEPPFNIGVGGGGGGGMMSSNSSEPLGAAPLAPAFKMEHPSDMIYCQNGSEPNHNSDGLMSTFFNDDIFMDVPSMNEGVFGMRVAEGGGGCGAAVSGSADSDSAVSSMGSERVPSLPSDTDWMETNSDSGHTPADHFMASTDHFQPQKGRWYDYQYRQQSCDSGANAASGGRMPPVAQKKHHLYGRRQFCQEQNSGGVRGTGVVGEGSRGPTEGAAPETGVPAPVVKFEYPATMAAVLPSPLTFPPSSPLDMVKPPTPEDIKFSASLAFARQHHNGLRSSPSENAVHNHSYHMPPEHSGALQRPLTRDKKASDYDDLEDDGCAGHRDEASSLSRDERRAHQLSVPIPVYDIINLPMDEFNERLSKFDLTEAQLTLIRDIRRRGKNKVAAQNCRKRKLDQITSLADDLRTVQDTKVKTREATQMLLIKRYDIQRQVQNIYNHILQELRDSEGNPLRAGEWHLVPSLRPDGRYEYNLARQSKADNGTGEPSTSPPKDPYARQE